MAYYRGKSIGAPSRHTKLHFGLVKNGKFAITIVEGNCYSFEAGNEFYDIMLDNGGVEQFISLVCKVYFNKLFFTPQKNKKYDITVKEVKH